MPNTREWSRGGDDPLPERVEEQARELMGALLISAQEEIKRIVGHGDLYVAANIAISFQRFPGDTTPFLAIGSFPDDERVAWGFIRKIYDIMESRGLGQE